MHSATSGGLTGSTWVLGGGSLHIKSSLVLEIKMDLPMFQWQLKASLSSPGYEV